MALSFEEEVARIAKEYYPQELKRLQALISAPLRPEQKANDAAAAKSRTSTPTDPATVVRPSKSPSKEPARRISSSTDAVQPKATGPVAKASVNQVPKPGPGFTKSGATTTYQTTKVAPVSSTPLRITPTRPPQRTSFNPINADRIVPESDSVSIPEAGPHWYQSLLRVNTRDPRHSDADIKLKSLKECIRQCKRDPNSDHTSRFQQIRDNLHDVTFLQVTPQILRNESMLHAVSGLPQLFLTNYSGGVPWPFDIRADAREQYNKWSRKVFETDITRGLIMGRAKKGTGSREPVEDASRTRFDPDFGDRVSAHYIGNGNLVNGQWWPLWHAALRDGAHGSIMGGIYGDLKEGGAFSCVLSAGKDYDDEDNGDWLWYCGTDSADSNPTDATRMLLLNEASGVAVRLLRSSEASWKSSWAPERGLRYDGLYRVASHECRDQPGRHRQRYRFRLERLPQQDPIRSQGRSKRPTQQELTAYENVRKSQGYQ